MGSYYELQAAYERVFAYLNNIKLRVDEWAWIPPQVLDSVHLTEKSNFGSRWFHKSLSLNI